MITKQHLKILATILPKNPVLFSLEHVLLTKEGVSATDLNVQVLIKEKLVDEDVAVEGRMFLKAATFINEDTKITTGHNRLGFANKRNTIEINRVADGDIPVRIKNEGGQHLGSLSTSDVKKLLKLIPFLGRDDLRMNLMHINIQGKEAVATDANILKSVLIEGDILPCITDGCMVHPDVIKMLSYASQTWNVVRSGEHIFFISEKIEISQRIYDERYPNWKPVLPVAHNLITTVNRKDLIAAVKRANLFVNAFTRQSRIHVSNNKMIIKGVNFDKDCFYNEELDVSVKHTGLLKENEIEFGINTRYFLTALNSISEEEVTLSTNNPKTAILINDKTLVMPMMLSEY